MRNTLLPVCVACAVFLASYASKAQSYVLNSSFEQFDQACPDFQSYPHLLDWYVPDCAFTPGLVHACNSIGSGAGVPLGANGYQQALDGDAFISLWTLLVNSEGPITDGNPQKYAAVSLVEPLQAGQRYCLRFGVNLADSSNYRTGTMNAWLLNGTPTACDGNDQSWADQAQFAFDITQVDTSAWTILEGDFVAVGGESTLVLGAFQWGEDIDSVFIRPQGSGAEVARYYIDDVKLVPCNGVGVDEMERNGQMEVFPNPASTHMNVRLVHAPGTGWLEFRAPDGRIVMAQGMNTAMIEMDVSSLPPSSYLLRLMADGVISHQPVVIVK